MTLYAVDDMPDNRRAAARPGEKTLSDTWSCAVMCGERQ